MGVVESGVDWDAIDVSINRADFDDSVRHSWETPGHFNRVGAEDVEKWSVQVLKTDEM